MPQITPDQLDDLLETADVFMDNGDDFSPPEDQDVAHDPRLRFLAELNDLLAQDSGSAGTHAYDMIAAVEEINAGNTAVLIELIAATVMMKRQDNPLPDTISVTFSPSDIDDMQRAYHMDAKRDGMQLTVTLTKKAEPSESWQLAEEPDTGEALEQATEPPERPVWCVRTGDGSLVPCADKKDAEAVLRAQDLDPMAHVENRFCLHPDCPSTGCNKAEVTSDA